MSIGEVSGNMGANRYGDKASESTSPAVRFGDVVDPNAGDVDFDTPVRAFYIGTTGNVSLVGIDGKVTLFTGVGIGGIYDIQIIGTRAASTTVTILIPLY